MVVKKPNEIKSSEITDEQTYLNRRNFIRAGLLAGTTLTTAGLYRFINQPPVEGSRNRCNSKSRQTRKF